MRPLLFEVGPNQPALSKIPLGVYVVGIDHDDGERGTRDACARLAAGERPITRQAINGLHPAGLADNVTVTNPRDLPALRNRLATDIETIYDDTTPRTARVIAGSAVRDLLFERRFIRPANLLWVADDLCDVVASARTTLSGDVTLGDTDPVWPQGLALFASPLTGMSALDTETDMMTIAGVLWSEHMVVDPDGGAPHRCLGMSWITNIDFERPSPMLSALISSIPHDPTNSVLDAATTEAVDTGAIIRLTGSTWCIAGRSDWQFGDRIDSRLPDIDDVAHASMVEDRQTMYALWALMRQERIVETETVSRGGKKSRREARRTPVRVVRLRRARTAAGERDESTEARTQSVQYAVRGHWRMQACGPRLSQRRATWIHPHTRGPENAPFKVSETVWSLDQ